MRYNNICRKHSVLTKKRGYEIEFCLMKQTCVSKCMKEVSLGSRFNGLPFKTLLKTENCSNTYVCYHVTGLCYYYCLLFLFLTQRFNIKLLSIFLRYQNCFFLKLSCLLYYYFYNYCCFTVHPVSVKSSYDARACMCLWQTIHYMKNVLMNINWKMMLYLMCFFYLIWFEKGLRDEKTSSLWVNTRTLIRENPLPS